MHSIFGISIILGAILGHCLAINEIKDLPGVQFDLNFEHYSGYLNASETRFLHYWFVDSQGHPEIDPLIFWFNGGPGCSSLEGILAEMGPYVVNIEGKTLRKNPDAWNTFASVVYVESPAGVGYSYVTNDFQESSDETTADENYAALKHFFDLHPNFRNNSVFIIGESYAGIYVPMLINKIIDGLDDFPLNIEGMGIGNGFVSNDLNSFTGAQFAYSHGLIDEDNFRDLEEICCDGCIDCCSPHNLSYPCQSMFDAYAVWSVNGLNPYDIYGTCVKDGSTYRPIVSQSFSKTLANSIPGAPCLGDAPITTYMNLPEVRKALNIPDHVRPWEICSAKVGAQYIRQIEDVSDYVHKAVENNVRILLYYGDTDGACNYMMGQMFANELGYAKKALKQAWVVNGQIGGFKTVYDKNVTFTTIRGAGHMAPQWRAPETAHAIKSFVLNQQI